jgi:hypothetical protein
VKQAGPSTIYNSARLELMEDLVYKDMIQSPIGMSSPMFVNAGLISPREEQGKFSNNLYRRNVQAANAYNMRRNSH